MALKSVLGDPDKEEWAVDTVIILPASTVISAENPVAVWTKITTTRKTKLWTAATRDACFNYVFAYTNENDEEGVSYEIVQTNKVVNAWQLVLVITHVESVVVERSGM